MYVFTNNHYGGQAPANALQLRAMIEKRKVDVPGDLVKHFPFLEAIATQTGGQTSEDQTLFEM